nr:hypothetical protein [Tanacetum cinerariifolium]
SYWASVYMLPNIVVINLEKLFRRFLWNSRDSAKGKAKVTWSSVCKPKDQGGLGIKPLHKWNEVLLISQLSKLIDRKESLWVKWVNTRKLKNLRIWEVDHSVNDSWGWKNLLMLKDKVKPYVLYKIGNGKDISAWHDTQCSIGPLDRVVSNRDLYDANVAIDAKVADIISKDRWNSPDGWVKDFVGILNLVNQLTVRVRSGYGSCKMHTITTHNNNQLGYMKSK